MRPRLKHIIQYDINTYLWINSKQQYQALTTLARWISKSGDGYFYLALGIFIAGIEQNQGTYFLVSGLISFAIEIPLYILLKNLFKRNRPYVTLNNASSVIEPADKFSLPSGHSAAAFLMATLIGFYYPGFFPIVLSWACLIALSRVVLGVHYPSDVMVGMLLGILIAEFTLTITTPQSNLQTLIHFSQ